MNEEYPTTGPMPSLQPRPHNFRRFDVLIGLLQDWRNEDHADAINLTRNQVIEILDGVKALRRC